MTFREMLRKHMAVEIEWFWKKTVFGGFGFLMLFIGSCLGWWLRGLTL